MRSRRLVLKAGALGIALLAGCLPMRPAAAGALDGMGAVFLHGKGGWAGSFDGGIMGALEAEGASIAKPEMPWSMKRGYGATYDEAMAEIDRAVAELKARGAMRIVVIGHSLGANAAIGYASRHPGLAGVVAISAGHLPETAEMQGRTGRAIAEAKQLIAAGRGDVRQAFPDLVQGIPIPIRTTPVIYLSMFAPDGPAVIPRNAAAMGSIPLLWVVGRLDPIHARGPDYAYSKGAKNPKSRYLEVFAGHTLAPVTARRDIVAWIKSL